MLKLIGDLIFGIGRVVGAVKYRFGVIVPVPQRYRSSRCAKDGDESSS